MMAHKRTLEFSNVEWSVFLKKIKEQHTMATDGIESDKRDLKEVQEVSAPKTIKLAENNSIVVALFLQPAVFCVRISLSALCLKVLGLNPRSNCSLLFTGSLVKTNMQQHKQI